MENTKPSINPYILKFHSHSISLSRALALSTMLTIIFTNPTNAIENPSIHASRDPITRHIHIEYKIPETAPQEVVIECFWTHWGEEQWRPALVTPYISETAWALAEPENKDLWFNQKRIIEKHAAGLVRTLIFNPYPEAQRDGQVDIQFRLRISTPQKTTITEYTIRIQHDNRDVVTIEDWTQVIQKDGIIRESQNAEGNKNRWIFKENKENPFRSFGNWLEGNAGPHTSLPQLTYPLDLRGTYAVFVCAPGSIMLRFTGDERLDHLSSRAPGQEVLWRWKKMNWQHLVIKQPHRHNGWGAGSIDYIKFVPLTDELITQLEAPYAGKPDKIIAGFWEPYSWSFHNDIQNTLQHREVLTAYKEARFTIVDTQVNRFGEKSRLRNTLNRSIASQHCRRSPRE